MQSYYVSPPLFFLDKLTGMYVAISPKEKVTQNTIKPIIPYAINAPAGPDSNIKMSWLYNPPLQINLLKSYQQHSSLHLRRERDLDQ
jgi:hypothetical protein